MTLNSGGETTGDERTSKRPRIGSVSYESNEDNDESMENKKNILHDQILKFFEKKNISFDTIEDPDFLALFNTLGFNMNFGSEQRLSNYSDLEAMIIDFALASKLINNCHSYNITHDIFEVENRWFHVSFVIFTNSTTYEIEKHLLCFDLIDDHSNKLPPYGFIRIFLERCFKLNIVYQTLKSILGTSLNTSDNPRIELKLDHILTQNNEVCGHYNYLLEMLLYLNFLSNEETVSKDIFDSTCRILPEVRDNSFNRPLKGLYYEFKKIASEKLDGIIPLMEQKYPEVKRILGKSINIQDSTFGFDIINADRFKVKKCLEKNHMLLLNNISQLQKTYVTTSSIYIIDKLINIAQNDYIRDTLGFDDMELDFSRRLDEGNCKITLREALNMINRLKFKGDKSLVPYISPIIHDIVKTMVKSTFYNYNESFGPLKRLLQLAKSCSFLEEDSALKASNGSGFPIILQVLNILNNPKNHFQVEHVIAMKQIQHLSGGGYNQFFFNSNILHAEYKDRVIKHYLQEDKERLFPVLKLSIIKQICYNSLYGKELRARITRQIISKSSDIEKLKADSDINEDEASNDDSEDLLDWLNSSYDPAQTAKEISEEYDRIPLEFYLFDLSTESIRQHSENFEYAIEFMLQESVFESVTKEFSDYMNHKVVGRISNPLEFWKENKLKYPLLSEYAMDLFNIPLSNADTEELFDIAKDTYVNGKNFSDHNLFTKTMMIKSFNTYASEADKSEVDKICKQLSHV